MNFMQRMHKARHTSCTFLQALGLGGTGGASVRSPIVKLTSMLPPTPASGSGFTSWRVADLRKIASNARRILHVNSQSQGNFTAQSWPHVDVAFRFRVAYRTNTVHSKRDQLIARFLIRQHILPCQVSIKKNNMINHFMGTSPLFAYQNSCYDVQQKISFLEIQNLHVSAAHCIT